VTDLPTPAGSPSRTGEPALVASPPVSPSPRPRPAGGGLVAVAVLVTVRGEPVERLVRLVRALADQRDVAPFEIVVAALPDEAAALALDPVWDDLVPTGAVARLRFVPNPSGARSPGLNAAAAAAHADLVVRVDARSCPGPDHVARSVARLLADPDVGVVGGVQRPVAVQDDLGARAVARALGNPWALGGAAYRRGIAGPADTVYLGAYRRRELLALGGFDEHLDANEDFDLCRRYRAGGAVVWLEDGLVIDYEARSTVGAVWQQYEAFGRAKVRFWRRTGERPGARQVAPLVVAAVGAAALAATAGRPRRLAALAAAGVAALAAVDRAGAAPARDTREQLATMAVYPVVVGAWVWGVAAEAVRPQATEGDPAVR